MKICLRCNFEELQDDDDKLCLNCIPNEQRQTKYVEIWAVFNWKYNQLHSTGTKEEVEHICNHQIYETDIGPMLIPVKLTGTVDRDNFLLSLSHKMYVKYAVKFRN